MHSVDPLLQLVNAVRANPRYRFIDQALIQRIGQGELLKRKNLKEAVKATRNKLHQVGGAYQEDGIEYQRWTTVLETLPGQLSNLAVQDFCRSVMVQHASTRERLPILDRFFHETLGSLVPITSILDLACGLNPLAIPWMPLSEETNYAACDIYSDLEQFLNNFFNHFNINAHANLQDLLAPDLALPKTQVALLLKTIPCLEQVDKAAGQKLLDIIPADHILISFPVHSLGGHNKGMLEHYERHFDSLTTGRGWLVKRFEFPTELAFLVSK